MTTSVANAAAVPRYVIATKWIWLVGIAISTIGSIVGVVLASGAPFAVAALVVTIVQAALAVPAALMLLQRKRWARMVLMVLALLSIASLYQAFKLQNWPSLILNLVLAVTFGLLQDPSVREYFGLPARRGRNATS